MYVGIKGSVVALVRSNGAQAWATHLKGYSFVHVVVEDGKVYAATNGEVFCLDPLTGEGLWQNPLKGYGIGLATLATAANPRGGLTPVMAEKRRRDDAAAGAAAAASG